MSVEVSKTSGRFPQMSRSYFLGVITFPDFTGFSRGKAVFVGYHHSCQNPLCTKNGSVHITSKLTPVKSGEIFWAKDRRTKLATPHHAIQDTCSLIVG